MTNVKFDIEDYRDIELLNMYKERTGKGYDEKAVMESIYAKGRDNARTPMQWDDSENAGFTTGTPWLRCNPNYTMINAAEELVNQDSVFYYYQKLIRLRKELDVFVDGVYEPLLEKDENIFAYTRENEEMKMLVLCNFREKNIECSLEEGWENGELLISNYESKGEKGMLRPYEAKMVLLKKEA